MHSMKTRFISVLALVALLGTALFVGISGREIAPIEEPAEEETPVLSSNKDTVVIWYTDEALGDYLNSAAISFAAENEDVRVIPELVSGMEYLENISAVSVEGEHYPDLYIITNDNLEKAHLAGLANIIDLPDDETLGELFPEVSVNACTYKNELVAYPFYFECAAFLYNKTYLDNWALAAAEAEIDAEEGEAAQQEMDNADSSKLTVAEEITVSEEDVLASDNQETELTEEEKQKLERINQRSEELLRDSFPTSVEKLLSFSDMYDAPESVDTIFKWDVTDIFYNYFFIGDSINVGGDYGDDVNLFDVYNEAAIRGLMTYQDLNQFFSISTDDVDYYGVLDDFINGKILFTIVTSDAVNTLHEATENGDMESEYAFCDLPEIMDGVAAKSMSVTDVIAVNGYSYQKEWANKFALYLCKQDGAGLYERTGKVSALKNCNYGELDRDLKAFANEYSKSEPLPKMMETSNLWVKLEILFAQVWNSEDANKGLKSMTEDMLLQITGEETTLDEIYIEKEVVEEDEIIETDTLNDGPSN